MFLFHDNVRVSRAGLRDDLDPMVMIFEVTMCKTSYEAGARQSEREVGDLAVKLHGLQQRYDALFELLSEAAPLRWAFGNGEDIMREAYEFEKKAMELLKS